MPGLVPGIHVLAEKEDVDGRAKPGHDRKPNPMQPFPWDDAMRFGLGVLRLSPTEFWRMTPRELALAAQAVTGVAPPLTRATFAQLMQRFHDGRSAR